MRRQGIEDQEDKSELKPEEVSEPVNDTEEASAEDQAEGALEEMESERQTGPLEAGRPAVPAADLEARHTQMIQSLSPEEHKELFLSMTGFSQFLRSTNRLFWTNFLMGLARGIGFVIGVSIIGAVFVTIWNELLSVTGIGSFLGRILEEMHQYSGK